METCIIDPHSLSGPLGIVSSELGALSNKAGDVSILGGFNKDGSYGWVATDSALDIVCTKTGNRLSSFNFSQVGGSSSIIKCVKDYTCRGSFQLLVGLQTASDKGMVCRFHPHSSKLLTVATFPQAVTSIEPVTSAGGTESPNFALSEELRKFFGIVAVGTRGGHVYLLDMKLDEGVEFLEPPQARHVQTVTRGEPNMRQRRLKAAARGEHLCLDLNGDTFSYYYFNYCKPDGSVFKSFPIGDVSVTSLAYIPQIGSLAVGFSFGCFQLWRLWDASLEFSGPLSREPSPIVTHFAYQEPEDDPQNFCYLWVARCPQPDDAREEILTDIHLFQLAYESKTHHPGHGHVFKDLNDCSCRFEHCLTFDPLDGSDENSWGSRLLACYTLERALLAGSKLLDDSTSEEEDKPMDLSLAVFVWEGCPSGAELPTSSCHYVALFDLDRYYQAQMPSFIKPDDMREQTPYFSFYNLESVVEAASPDFALNVFLDKSSITKYQSTYQPVPEDHLHPSALSFRLVCLAESSLVHAEFLGIQRKILADLCSQGPVVLREPRGFYLRCWNAHLIQRRNYIDQTPANLNQASQREAILTVALEHNLLGFLVACISSWSQGDFTSGMNLRSILEWAWGKVASIKQSVDDMCTSFYDGYGMSIDSQTYKTLESYSTQLCHMVTLFQALLDQSGTTTEQGVKDLETKLCVVTLLSQHLKMVLWFAHSGLLPESADNMGFPRDGQFCYPSSLLRMTYAQRRAELTKMCRNDTMGDIMLIDGLVGEAGVALTSLWDRKEEGGTGIYPPPSLHALLDMYLLEHVPLATKHCIVGYLLLDIISVSNDAKHLPMISKLEQFYQVFNLPLGLTKLLQAFWLLDHRDYEEALAMLLDPNTNNDLLSWQHTRIIKLFLYHGQAKRALQYVRCVKPALEMPDDVRLHLTVLLANGLTAEAFQFQREYRDPSTMDDLLYHIFLGSQQTKTMDQLLRLPFDDVEESLLERYLQETTEPNSKELLVMHYLQRTRFVDAIRLNQTLRQQAMMGDSDPLARERTSARNIITESYVNVLPRVQRRLAFDSETRQRKPVGIRREVPRPKPLSTIINPAKSSKVISHALLLNAVLDRIAEARDVMKADQSPTMHLDDTFEHSPCVEPFVGTPMTPRNRTMRKEDISVVYPETLEAEETAPYIVPLSSSLNLSVNQSLRSLAAMETPRALKDHFKRPPLDYSGAEALALLQTPPVKRKTPSLKPEPQVTLPTPQSILKVRRAIRRSPSPPKGVSERTHGKAALDISMPSPPPFQSKALSFADDDAEKPKETTPGRHIRFSDDTASGDSSPPDINELLPEPPNFAARQETPSPNLDPQTWSTPPISPEGSPDREQAVTPPFQSPPQEVPPVPEDKVHGGPAPFQLQPQALDQVQEAQRGGVGQDYLILTPKSKAPTPRQSLILTPKMKPPSPRLPSPQAMQQEVENDVFPVRVVDEDAPTPPIGDEIQVAISAGAAAAVEGAALAMDEAMEEEDEEVTFNFSLRHGASPGLDGSPVAMATNDADEDLAEVMDTGEDGAVPSEQSTSPSPGPPLSFLFQLSPRQPIHPLSPFQFSAKDVPDPARRAEDAAGPSTSQPTPPRASQDLDIEQAFLDKSSPTAGADWQLTFDEETEEEDGLDVVGGADKPMDAHRTEVKVHFGEDAVFEIPTGVPKHVRESVHIQTSPVAGLTSDLRAAPAEATERAEMSVQTTPGLALRQREVEKTPPRIPFAESVVSRDEEEHTTAVVITAEEPSPAEGEALPAQEPAPKTPPRSPRTPRSKAQTPTRSSPRIKARQQQQRQQPPPPSQPSFLFSPPLTRSRGRRSARKIITRETASPLPPPLVPADLHSQTTLTVPSPLPGESLTLTGASGGRSAMRSGRRGRPTSAAAAETSMTQIKERPSVGHSRSTRGSSHAPSPSLDDHVVLLSPATPGPDSETSKSQAVRRNPRRAVRLAPHSMTLRTPQERKVRKVKPW
ncbi:protein ELYS-like [Diadema antillarum]|uniref:protein ELYS-like n=1 Tax=Diadema antillarum TaxID=105358 RepID=UPI003A8B343E